MNQEQQKELEKRLKATNDQRGKEWLLWEYGLAPRPEPILKSQKELDKEEFDRKYRLKIAQETPPQVIKSDYELEYPNWNTKNPTLKEIRDKYEARIVKKLERKKRKFQYL